MQFCCNFCETLTNNFCYVMCVFADEHIFVAITETYLCHFKSLRWLEVNERIEYKLLSLAYKVLAILQFSYLDKIISFQPPGYTRSSNIATLLRPPVTSSLKIIDRSFRYAATLLWNKLPYSLRPHTTVSIVHSL